MSQPVGQTSPRRVAIAALAIATAAALAGCGDSLGDDDSGGGSDGPVDIGLLIPQSGVYAPLGEDMEQGFRLYLDEHGGTLAGRSVDVSVADEGDGPDTGIPAAQRLVQSNVDAVVGIVSSAVALGARDLFEESEIPLVVANAGADDITGSRRSDFVWRTSFANGEVSAAIGPTAARQCQSAFLIGADYAAGKEHVAGFESTFTAAGGTIAGSVFPPFGSTENYQPFLSQIQRSGAACAFAFFAGSEAVAFTKQYAEFGLKDRIPLYSSGFLTEGGVLTAAGDAAVGIQTSLHYTDQLDTPRNRQFVDAYRAAYGEPPTVYAVQAYDAAQVLDTALAEGSGGQQIVDGLGAIETVDSPRGRWRFDDGHNPDQTFFIRRVEQVNGQLVNTVIGQTPAP